MNITNPYEPNTRTEYWKGFVDAKEQAVNELESENEHEAAIILANAEVHFVSPNPGQSIIFSRQNGDLIPKFYSTEELASIDVRTLIDEFKQMAKYQSSINRRYVLVTIPEGKLLDPHWEQINTFDVNYPGDAHIIEVERVSGERQVRIWVGSIAFPEADNSTPPTRSHLSRQLFEEAIRKYADIS